VPPPVIVVEEPKVEEESSSLGVAAVAGIAVAGTLLVVGFMLCSLSICGLVLWRCCMKGGKQVPAQEFITPDPEPEADVKVSEVVEDIESPKVCVSAELTMTVHPDDEKNDFDSDDFEIVAHEQRL